MTWLPQTVQSANNIPLVQKQRLFAQYFAQWVVWVCSHPEYSVRFAEGYVADTDAADGDHDGPHIAKGGHYTRLAMDVILEFRSEWIKDGDHPAWLYVGEQWEAMHPLARWGGRFGDGNHLSFEHQGVK